MEHAKLILDYLKALVWPLVVACFLLLFSSEIRGLLVRMKSVTSPLASATFGTGESKDVPAEKTSTHPDVWFDFRPASLARPQCMEKAKVALRLNGFTGGAAAEGGMVYGYTERFVGLIWCGAQENIDLITVAGPYREGLRSRHSNLAEAFRGATP